MIDKIEKILFENVEGDYDAICKCAEILLELFTEELNKK